MSKQLYTVSKEGLEYLCGLINKIVTLPSDVISDITLSTNKTMSSVKIDKLIEQCLKDANDKAIELVNALTHLTCEKTTVQPTLDNSGLNIIYLYSSDGNAPFEQYLKISETELIDMGSTSISLNDYLTVTDAVNTYAKKVDLDTLTTEVTNIKSDFTTHKNDADIHTSADEKASYVKKTDITTTIDSTSTDDEVPSAKSVYDKLINKLDNTIILRTANEVNSFDKVYQSFIIQPSVADEIGLPSLPSSTWFCIHYSHFKGFKYPSQIAFEYAGLERIMYRTCGNGVWSNWRKICTTSVADVARTNITSRVLNATVNSGGGVSYSVKNGICYVQFASITTTVASSGQYILSTGTLPFVDNSLSNGHYPIVSANSSNGLVVVEGNTGGVRYYGGAITIFTTISYPVKEL